MRIKTCLASLIIVTSVLLCHGQDYGDNENWIGEIEGGSIPYLIQRFEKYTKEDVSNAKQRLKKIREKPLSNDSWDGTYDVSGELSETRLVWSSEDGFISYYIYTCEPALRALNYGNVKEDPYSLELFSEKPSAKTDGINAKKSTYIKVKWGDVRYLVPKTNIEDFALLASGYFGETIETEQKWEDETYTVQERIENFAWVNVNDRRTKKIFGVPEFPKEYQHLVKSVIESEIISLGKTISRKSEDDDGNENEYQLVTIGVGKNNGVEIGMEFFVPEIKDRIVIEKVSKSTAVGYIASYSQEYIEKEKCYFHGEYITCVNPKIGMQVKTIPKELLDD